MKRYKIITFKKGEFWHCIAPKEFRAPGENRTHDPLSSSLKALTPELLEASWQAESKFNSNKTSHRGQGT